MKKIKFAEQKLSSTTIPSYQISYAPIPSRLSKVLSPIDYEKYNALLESAQTKPKKHLQDIKNFYSKHSDLSEVGNLLSYTYIRLKKIKKADELIMENYKHNPQSFFTCINYADLCLRKDKLEAFDAVFKGKHHLSEIYPERSWFHYSEVSAFYNLLSFYFLKKGEKNHAFDFYNFAKLVDPDDPASHFLRKKLYRRTFIKVLASIFASPKNKAKVNP